LLLLLFDLANVFFSRIYKTEARHKLKTKFEIRVQLATIDVHCAVDVASTSAEAAASSFHASCLQMCVWDGAYLYLCALGGWAIPLCRVGQLNCRPFCGLW